MRDLDVTIEMQARLAAALGLVALTMVMFGPCGCGGTLPLAGPLGAGSALFGLRVRNLNPSRSAQAYATGGLLAGSLAALLVLAYTAAVGVVIALWVWGIASASQLASALGA